MYLPEKQWNGIFYVEYVIIFITVAKTVTKINSKQFLVTLIKIYFKPTVDAHVN